MPPPPRPPPPRPPPPPLLVPPLLVPPLWVPPLLVPPLRVPPVPSSAGVLLQAPAERLAATNKPHTIQDAFFILVLLRASGRDRPPFPQHEGTTHSVTALLKRPTAASLRSRRNHCRQIGPPCVVTRLITGVARLVQMFPRSRSASALHRNSCEFRAARVPVGTQRGPPVNRDIGIE